MGKGSGAGGGGGKGRNRILTRLPTRTGTYRIRLSALKDVPYTNFRKGGVESIRLGLDQGKTFGPLKMVIERDGGVHITDGNHRLRVYRERGYKTVQVKFDVWRGKGTWALAEEKRRR